MNISLTPHLESLVKTKVESGLYNSTSVALRLLEERDQLNSLRMEAIKARGRARLAAQESDPNLR